MFWANFLCNRQRVHTMDTSFEGKRILVTGGCQGFGKAICIRLLQLKGTVVALSNNKENLDKLREEHPLIQTVFVDLADWNATRAAVKGVLPIDMLVNNAGVSGKAPVLTASPEFFDNIFNVNVKAMLNVSQIVGGNMIERKVAGSIVNLSSAAGESAIKDHIVYCSSKAAVTMMTKCLALDLGPHNIRTNCVQPTIVLTELGKRVWSDPERLNEVKKRIPLGRFAEVEEVVDTVVFLLSNRASMINGVALPVDGGYLVS